MRFKAKYEIYNEDCFATFKRLQKKSIDLVLCDPPYGTTACEWDCVIPFAPMWKNLSRVSKKNAVVIIMAAQPFTSSLIMSNPSEFKYCWYWKKRPVNFLNAKKQPLREVEDIVVFQRGVGNYYPQGLISQKRVNRRSNQTSSVNPHGQVNESEFTNYPTQLIDITGERGDHPTQKPISLMNYLIRTYTKEGDTVLDFCMGSGTTGVACGDLGRFFIGCDCDSEHFATAKKRIRRSYNRIIQSDKISKYLV